LILEPYGQLAQRVSVKVCDIHPSGFAPWARCPERAPRGARLIRLRRRGRCVALPEER